MITSPDPEPQPEPRPAAAGSQADPPSAPPDAVAPQSDPPSAPPDAAGSPADPPSALPAAAAGLAATAAGIGVGHLAASWIGASSSPVFAVSAAVVDRTPRWLKEFAIATFGTADKAVLLSVVAVVTLVLGGAAGVAQRRRPGLGVGIFGVLGLAAGWAAWSRPDAPPLALIPTVLGVLVGIAALRWLTGRVRVPVAAELASPPRRLLLGATATTMLGGVAAGGLGQGRISRATPGRTFALPAPTSALPPLTSGLDVAGLTPWRTPVTDFFRIDTALTVPRIDAAQWRLTIDGDVENPLTLSYADLLELPMIEADITLNCVSNPVGGDYIGSTRWLGTPVAELLARVGIRASADQFLTTSQDGMTISVPVEALTDPDRGALLVVGMGGAPLTPAHGYPVRLLTPGLYGYVGATKWLRRMTATTYAAAPAYWSERGWAPRAAVQTQARIDVPRGKVSAGAVIVAGVAWSQARRGITGVEVRVDDGPWEAATLGPDGGSVYWRQWTFTWAATEGEHRLTVRATDGTGTVQTTQVAPPAPSGATGLHEVTVRVG